MFSRPLPELSGFDPAEQRRLLRVARERTHRRRRHALLCVLVYLLVFLPIAIVTIEIFDSEPDSEVYRWWIQQPEWFTAVSWLMGSLLMVGIPLWVSLMLRRRLLLARLSALLAGRDPRIHACPRCAHSLAGLTVPATLEIACPECGHRCVVDRAMSAVPATGSMVVEGTAILFRRARFWTRERVRRWAKVSAVALAIIVVTIGIPLALYEWHIRVLAEQARREAPTNDDVDALTRRLRPDALIVEKTAFAAALDRVAERLQETELLIEANHGALSWGWTEVDAILAPPSDSSTDDEEARPSPEAMQRALEFVEAAERNGAFDALVDLRASPVERRRVGVEVARAWTITLPQLSEARRAGRTLRARMRLALARGDQAVAGAALASLIDLSRGAVQYGFFIEQMVGDTIETWAFREAQRWLAADPTAAEVDDIERALFSVPARDPVELPIGLEAIVTGATLASDFGNPKNTRLVPLRGLRVMSVSEEMGWWVESPGSWITNRDALAADVARALALTPLEPFERAAAAAALPLPAMGGAEAYERLRSNTRPFTSSRDGVLWHERSTRVMIALERWRLAHGEYPANLDALVPAFLASIPVDPHSGNALRFRRVDPASDRFSRRYLLYSVGVDGRDDGGREATEADMASADSARTSTAAPSPGVDSIANDAPPIPRSPAP